MLQRLQSGYVHVLCAIGHKDKGFFWTSVNVMQTYGKKEEAPVAFSSFSAFLFFPPFSGVKEMLKGSQQALLMHSKPCWSRLTVAWIQDSVAMLVWTLFWP